MAIPPVNLLSNEPGGGYMAARKGINAVTKGNLENKMNEIKNAFLPAKSQAEIEQSNALTNKYNTMTPLEAKELEIKNQFGPEREQANIESARAMANYRNSGGFGRGVAGKELNDMSTQIQQENPDFSSDQVLDARSAYLEGRDTLSDGTPLPEPSGTMLAMLETNHKRRTDVAQRSQERYADTVETAVKSADANLKAATKYAGLLGHGTGGLEAAKSILGGESSKDFQAFNNFVNVDVPTIAGEYMRQLGVNASDEQKRMYKNVVNPITWYSNPKMALTQWNYFKKLAKEVGVTVSKSAFKRHNDLNRPKKPSVPKAGGQNYTPEQMSHLSDDELAEVLNG